MSKTNTVLGGFDAIFGEMMPNESIKIKGVELIDDPNEPARDTRPMEIDEDDEDDIPLDLEINPDIEVVENPEKEPAATEQEKEIENIDESEMEQVHAFFDAIAEQIGWSDVTDEEKPKSVEDFVTYMKEAVEASSVPQYANDQIAELDEFVKNGGSIQDYFSVSNEVDYDGLDLSDLDTQKSLVGEYLKEKGFTDVQIKKKLEKYEDADLLEDEASDAIEFLKESKEENKKALLEAQKIAKATAIEEQQKFYNNVVTEIESLSDIRGIKIPKDDKKSLMEYIFKVESDGRTKYQKDYASKTKNLIESAYFTMKGDTLIDQAKRSGETSAVERLKKTLSSNKISGSKEKINNGSATPLWSIASQQLLRRPQ